MAMRKYAAFLRTVETGSITKAAEELGYTQSAVSKMIADLENECQMRLLTRSRAGVELTSEGGELLPSVRALVRSYNDLGFAVSELHGLRSGLLRIGCFTSFSTSVLPSVLKAFHEKYPNIRIQLSGGEYEEILDWLRRGALDCGFVALPVPAEFDAKFLLRDSFVAILPVGHSLSNAPCFPVAHLTQENFVKLNESPDYELDRFLDTLPERPRTTYEVTGDFTLLAMVERGLGVSIVHDLILHPRRYRVVRLPLDVTQFRDVGIAIRRGAEPSSVTRLFIEHVLSCKTQLDNYSEIE
ncbi:MAG: LysR family transcriptional regulator [Ruminococcaceae bacterium]|nr:LysR family transcriptional regulator [Oscillospiraceae bacterium]